MPGIRRYFCETCGTTVNDVGGVPAIGVDADGRPWSGACGCGRMMLDLSHFEARTYLEERAAAEEKRRDDLAVGITAPFALLGLCIGGATSYWLLHAVPVFHTAQYLLLLAIPLLTAGVFAVVPARFAKPLIRQRIHTLELSFSEVAELEAIEEARRHASAQLEAPMPSSTSSAASSSTSSAAAKFSRK